MTLPQSLKPALQERLRRVRLLREEDRRNDVPAWNCRRPWSASIEFAPLREAGFVRIFAKEKDFRS